MAAATVLAGASFASLMLLLSQPWWLALLVAALLWPLGFFLGTMGREAWARRAQN